MNDAASRRGRSSRRKGAQGERELASLLSDELGIPIKRMLGQERDGGADLHVGPLRIQVKRCQAVQMAAWWRQTLADAGDWVPVLAYRASRRPWTFRVPLGDVLCETDWDRMSWVEMPIGSFAWWAREKVALSGGQAVSAMKRRRRVEGLALVPETSDDRILRRASGVPFLREVSTED